MDPDVQIDFTPVAPWELASAATGAQLAMQANVTLYGIIITKTFGSLV